MEETKTEINESAFLNHFQFFISLDKLTISLLENIGKQVICNIFLYSLTEEETLDL